MKTKFMLVVLAVSALWTVSCTSPEKMKESASQIVMQSTPAVLEAKSGKVNAQVSVTFPAKYFQKKVYVELTPVLVYDGGEVAAPVKKLQGESVKDNFQSIAYEVGGTTQMDLSFDYKPEYRASKLVIRAAVLYKDKKIVFDEREVAKGVLATFELASAAYAGNDIKPLQLLADKYQKVTYERKSAQILYKINKADVAKNELKKSEIKDLMDFVKAGQTKNNLKGVTISAYASPDGPESLNSKLSEDRGKSSDKAVQQVLKKAKSPLNKEALTIKSISEDWEGFQELVAASDIQDKDLILRVLSMYNDPAVREREIKNMSKAFTILADKILPQLRRAKMIAEIEIKNLTDEQIKSADIETLELEQLIYGATLFTDDASKVKMYTKAAEKFGDYRAYNNLGVVLAKQKKFTDAKKALESAQNAKAGVPEITANYAAVLYALGDAKALTVVSQSGSTTANSKLILGANAIAKNDYKSAVTYLQGTGSFNEALAYVLTGDLAKASSVLKNLSAPNVSYLKAVIAARSNDAKGVTSNLAAAVKDANLKNRAAKDAEFLAFQPAADFQQLVK